MIMTETRKRIYDFRLGLIADIATILIRNFVDVLEAKEISSSTPVIIVDEDDANFTYTLDRISWGGGGTSDIYIDCSNCCHNKTIALESLDIEVIGDILDWLNDNEETITEVYSI